MFSPSHILHVLTERKTIIHYLHHYGDDEIAEENGQRTETQDFLVQRHRKAPGMIVGIEGKEEKGKTKLWCKLPAHIEEFRSIGEEQRN